MTDTTELYSRSAMQLVGYDMTQRAAQAALKEAGVSSKGIKVCEVHDCFSANELILLDGLGFSKPGGAHKMVRNGDITYGGQIVVNPSGGLISKGASVRSDGSGAVCGVDMAAERVGE
jgi:sterol carrier protein 2